MDILIIPYEKDKAEDVCIIHNSAFKSYIEEFGMLYGYKKLNPNDIRNWMNIQENKIWIAYADNEPVGFVPCSLEVKKKDNEILVVQIEEPTWGRGQSRISVIPSFRKISIARALVEHAIEYYKKIGAEVVVAHFYNDNELASQLFTKLGFKHKRFFFYYDKYSKTEPLEGDTMLASFDLVQPLPKITLNSEVNVRILTEYDLPAIKNILGELRPGLWGNNPSMGQIKRWYKFGRSRDGIREEALVAEYKGEVVGIMEYSSVGVIGIPGVLPQYRRKGIGSTLFYHLLKSMKEKGLFKALTDSGYVPERREAIRMYKRFNFDLSRKLWPWIKII